jgi:hypothetical protein
MISFVTAYVLVTVMGSTVPQSWIESGAQKKDGTHAYIDSIHETSAACEARRAEYVEWEVRKRSTGIAWACVETRLREERR